MNEIILNMIERRSIRKFKPDQIPDDELNAILQAGLYAPCAGGRQSTIIVVCRNNEINCKLGRINRSFYQGRISTESSYISKEHPSIADDAKLTDGFYGAPVVLTLFGPKNFLYTTPDCCVAAENIMLAAHSLGIGSCMVMRAEDSFASELGQGLQKEWGIDEHYEARVHVVLGYREGPMPAAKPRKENRIIIIE
ncbi:nitroreductase family protein [Treponema sp. OttesenSCG-928-L16]|nr:nitroreductase family protein [Treponema sp. OttesenSCG-928-L16]